MQEIWPCGPSCIGGHYGTAFMCTSRSSNSRLECFPPGLFAVDHGIFQMPTDACPSNFTGFATDNYQELAPSSTVRGQGTVARSRAAHFSDHAGATTPAASAWRGVSRRGGMQ